MSRRKRSQRQTTVIKIENGDQELSTRSSIRLNEKQRSALEGYFKQNQYPETELRKEIAEMINLEQKRVFIWFQNRRKKEKYGGYRVNAKPGPRIYPCVTPLKENISAKSIPPVVKESSKKKKDTVKRKERSIEEWPYQENDLYSYLPKWPITMDDYIPFQKEPFDKLYESNVDKDITTKVSKPKGRSKSKTNLKEDVLIKNSERLAELIGIIDDIRKDVLYVPMMDELYEGNHFNFVDMEPVCMEKQLIRSVQQLMEHSVFVENFKL